MLRALLSILLLAVFGLPSILPLLASGQVSDAHLPACCRRNGRHHCSMNTADLSSLLKRGDPQFRAPVEKCPFAPASVAPAQPNPLATPRHYDLLDISQVSHPSGIPQTESRRRIAQDRARHKRGPPFLSTLLA